MINTVKRKIHNKATRAMSEVMLLFVCVQLRNAVKFCVCVKIWEPMTVKKRSQV